MEPQAIRVSTAEFIKGYERLADHALSEAVTITKNGRDRLVVISASEYERLMRRNRRVIRSSDISDEVAEITTNRSRPFLVMVTASDNA